jgi:hypothetical protein
MRLPAVKIDYLKSFTDDTGVFQHAKYCIPRRNEGYTTDDNARALIVCAEYNDFKNDKNVKALANVYLAFLHYMQKPDGSFHNYLSYERRFLDVDGSDDCMGRALWSCGRTVNSSLPNDSKLVAKEIFDKGVPCLSRSISLRGYAFTVLGLYQCYKANPDDNLYASTEKLADNLVQQYQNEAKDDWHWFEPHLTYDNARLPQALFEAYMVTKKQGYLDVATESLDFILHTQMIDGKFVPIGNNGWYTHGGERAVYDQQPLEATALVEAAADAYYSTKKQRYAEFASLAFQWFLGRNTRKLMMYNPETSGCFDGLTPDEVNRNQGAESSISYLMARLKLDELKRLSGQEKTAKSASLIV